MKIIVDFVKGLYISVININIVYLKFLLEMDLLLVS